MIVPNDSVPVTKEEIEQHRAYALHVLEEAEDIFLLTGTAPEGIFKLAKISQDLLADLRLEALAHNERYARLEAASNAVSLAGNKMLVANVDYAEALIEKINEQKDTIAALRAKLREKGINDED